MVPHVKIQKGDTVYLLIRYGDRFRFVTVNERLTEAMERHILSAPCEDSELDMLRLSYEPLPVKDVWSYAMSDTEQGSGLMLYVKNEIYTYRFYEGCSAETMSAVLEGILPFSEATPPEPEIPQMEDWRLERQDPRVLRWIKPFSRCWNAVAIFFSLGALFLGGSTSLLVCTLIVPLTLLLYLLLPQYYSISFAEEYKKQGYSAPVERGFWTWAMGFPAWTLGLRQIYSGHFQLPLYYYLIVAAFLILPFFLKLLSREIRESRGVALMLALIMLCYGHAAPLFINRWLNDAPEPQPYEVLDVFTTPYKTNEKNRCWIELNGNRQAIHIQWELSQSLHPGDTVMVVHDKGALGFDYAYVVEKTD